MARYRRSVRVDDIMDWFVFGVIVLLIGAALFFAASAIFGLILGSPSSPPKTTVITQSLADGRQVECVVVGDSKAISCDWEHAALP